MVTNRMKTAWIGLSVLVLTGGFVSGAQGECPDLPCADTVYNVGGPAFDVTNVDFPWIWKPPVIIDKDYPWLTPEMHGIRGQYEYVGLVYIINPNLPVPLSPDIIVEPNGFVRTPNVVIDPNGVVQTPGIKTWGYTNTGILGGDDFGVKGIAEKGDGVYGKAEKGYYAGKFDGDVLVDGRVFIKNGPILIEVRGGLDYSEGFDVSGDHGVGPGTVLAIDPLSPGKLTVSHMPYDARVAGIVAGANGLSSGVRLGVGQFDHDVALAGRVYCNVDATQAAVEPGDLLTTAAEPGYAMKVTNYRRARGAILGKAMEGLEKGRKGQILVLVTLQ